jgi:hypothetical protein
MIFLLAKVVWLNFVGTVDLYVIWFLVLYSSNILGLMIKN